MNLKSLFYFLLFFLTSYASEFVDCNSESSCQKCDIFAELKQHLLLNYSQDTRPYLAQKPVNVTIQFLVMHLYNVNFEDQTYTVTGYLRQYWNDPRLQYDKDIYTIPYLTFSKDNRIWLPDTFISNSIHQEDRHSQANDLNMAYHYIRIFPSGDVIYSQMIETKLNSVMELNYYPYHVVSPNIIFESYGYFSNDLTYHIETQPLKFEPRTMNAPSFTIYTDIALSKANIVKYDTGLFSSVTHYFKLIPVREKNLLTIMVPINLLIFVNWLGFWMPVTKMFGTRISLGITALLADFALSFSLPIPETQHFMWINMYILISYAYISLGLLAAYKENRYITKEYGSYLMKKDSGIGGKLDELITAIQSSQHNELSMIIKESEQIATDILNDIIDSTVDNTDNQYNVIIAPNPHAKKNKYSFLRHIPFTNDWFNDNGQKDNTKEQILKHWEEHKGENTDLLIQPYITPRRRNMKWLYMGSWTLINALILILGEVYVRILIFN